MNKDTTAGVTKELKGKAMKFWSKLTEDDFTGFKGSVEELKGKVQKLYGYSKDQVEDSFQEFMGNGARTAQGKVDRVNESIDRKISGEPDRH